MLAMPDMAIGARMNEGIDSGNFTANTHYFVIYYSALEASSEEDIFIVMITIITVAMPTVDDLITDQVTNMAPLAVTLKNQNRVFSSDERV